MRKRMLRCTPATLVVWVLVVALSACSDNDNPTSSQDQDTLDYPIPLVALASLQDQGVRVTLKGPEQLQAGYTRLEVVLTDTVSDTLIRSAQVQIKPMMHMQTDDGIMSHSAPTEPGAGTKAIDGAFANPVVFIMPGTWELQVLFSAANGKQGSVTFEVEVEDSGRLARLTGDDGIAYYVVLVAPREPTVGLLDIEFAVFERETTLSFPPVTDLVIGMKPTMPSMGHGSPLNEDPLHTAAGHYHGKVNYIMTGDWRLDLTLERGGVQVASAYFDVEID